MFASFRSNETNLYTESDPQFRGPHSEATYRVGALTLNEKRQQHRQPMAWCQFPILHELTLSSKGRKAENFPFFILKQPIRC